MGVGYCWDFRADFSTSFMENRLWSVSYKRLLPVADGQPFMSSVGWVAKLTLKLVRPVLKILMLESLVPPLVDYSLGSVANVSRFLGFLPGDSGAFQFSLVDTDL
jgi:hypothetical protein